MTPTPNQLALLISLIGAGLSQPVRAMSATSVLVDEFAPTQLALVTEAAPDIKVALAPPVAGASFAGLKDPAALTAAAAQGSTHPSARAVEPGSADGDGHDRSHTSGLDWTDGRAASVAEDDLGVAIRADAADAAADVAAADDDHRGTRASDLGNASAHHRDLDPWGFPYRRAADGATAPAVSNPPLPKATEAVPGAARAHAGVPDLIEQLWASLPKDEPASAFSADDAAVEHDAATLADADVAALEVVRLDDDHIDVRSERVAGLVELDPWGRPYQRAVDKKPARVAAGRAVAASRSLPDAAVAAVPVSRATGAVSHAAAGAAASAASKATSTANSNVAYAGVSAAAAAEPSPLPAEVAAPAPVLQTASASAPVLLPALVANGRPEPDAVVDAEVQSERLAGAVELDPWGHPYRRAASASSTSRGGPPVPAVAAVARVPSRAAQSAQLRPEPIVDSYRRSDVPPPLATPSLPTTQIAAPIPAPARSPMPADDALAEWDRVQSSPPVASAAATPLAPHGSLRAPVVGEARPAQDAPAAIAQRAQTVDAPRAADVAVTDPARTPLEHAFHAGHARARMTPDRLAEAAADAIEHTLALPAGASAIEVLSAFTQQPLIEPDIDLTTLGPDDDRSSSTARVLDTLADVLSPQWTGPRHAPPEGSSAEDTLRRFLAEDDDDTMAVTATSTTPPTTAAAPASPFGDQIVAVRETQLDDVRGGFTTSEGLKVSFGIERAVYINGNLTASTTLTVNDLGKVSGGRDIGAIMAGAGLAVVQNGPGNVFQTGPISAQTLGTVIQNTLDNQKIQNVTTVNARLNSLGILKSMDDQSALRSAIIDSVRR